MNMADPDKPAENDWEEIDPDAAGTQPVGQDGGEWTQKSADAEDTET